MRGLSSMARRRARRLSLCGVLALLLSAPGAQAARLPEPLTLEECLRLADQGNPYIAAAEARLAESEADRRIARSPLLPDLRAEGRLAWVEPITTAAQSSLVVNGDESGWVDDHRASLLLRQRLYDFGRSSEGLDAAKARLTARQVELTDVRNQRRIEVMARFFDVLLADRRHDVANEAMAVAFVRFRDGRDRKEVGQISELELARLEDTFRTLRSRFIETQHQQRQARLRLATALGVEGEIPSQLLPPKTLPGPRELGEFEEIYQAALAKNPALRAAQAELAAAEADYRGARANYLPTLDAEARANYYTRKFVTRDRWYLGLALDWPLYQGGAQGGLRSKALARLQQSKALLGERRLRLREVLMDTVAEIQTLTERLREAETRLRYRSKSLDLGRSLYELELQSDLGNSMVDYTDAELFNAQVQYQLTLSLARLDALLGQPVRLDAPTVPVSPKESADAQEK
ncbi:MAG: TolC family protein [Pseudomonadota bacterium]